MDQLPDILYQIAPGGDAELTMHAWRGAIIDRAGRNTVRKSYYREEHPAIGSIPFFLQEFGKHV